MIERLIRLLLHRRWVVLGIAALITLLGAMSLSRLSFDNTVESWFLEGDPDLVVYDHFTATFKADQIIVVGLFAEDVFAADVLAAVEAISAGAASLRFADRVQSVTRSPVAAIRFDDPGFRGAVLESPLLRQQFLSPGLDATAIVIHYAREGFPVSELKYGECENMQIGITISWALCLFHMK